MKTTVKNNNTKDRQRRTYASLEEFVRAKMDIAVKSLEGVDLTSILKKEAR